MCPGSFRMTLLGFLKRDAKAAAPEGEPTPASPSPEPAPSLPAPAADNVAHLVRESIDMIELDLGKLIADKEADRTNATVGAALGMAVQGVQIVRVHDVRPMREALALQIGPDYYRILFTTAFLFCAALLPV